MSKASALRLSRTLFLLTALLLTTAVGCWEQWSDTWFPQMKRQKATQAFELVEYQGRVEGFLPPEGTVSIDDTTEEIDPNVDAEADALVNPRPMSLASLENGRLQFERYCVTCHGDKGIGDGPVSMVGEIRGPLGGVLPLAVATARSDGHVYTTIRHGRRRMPNYKRISSDDRWDVVNYIRYLNGQKGIGQ